MLAYVAPVNPVSLKSTTTTTVQDCVTLCLEHNDEIGYFSYDPGNANSCQAGVWNKITSLCTLVNDFPDVDLLNTMDRDSNVISFVVPY